MGVEGFQLTLIRTFFVNNSTGRILMIFDCRLGFHFSFQSGLDNFDRWL